jgi:hypothetical protein
MKSIRLTSFATALLLSSAAKADLSISNKPTQNMSCNAGICTATAKGANLNVGDLTAMLAAGDATVKTGGGAVTIQVLDGFSWATTSRLTLDANQTVGFRKLVSIAGSGTVTIAYNDGGTGGDLLFRDKGRVRFLDLRSKLVINRQPYVLVKSIKSIKSLAKPSAGGVALSDTIDASQEGPFTKAPVARQFGGTFEGLGNSIENLVIRKNTCFNEGVALFQDSAKGVLRDVILSDADVSVSGASGPCWVSALAGRGGLIENVHVSGTIHFSGGGRGDSDGVVGEVVGIGNYVNNSDAEGSVLAHGRKSFAGGLVGYSNQISHSHSAANVTADGVKSYAGGLAGSASLIEGSYSTGETMASNAGGLAGFAAKVDSSFATSSVQGSTAAGGLIGVLSYDGAILNSYSLGPVSGGVYGGGLFGHDDKSTANITSSYSVGTVEGQAGLTGGFAGYVSSEENQFSADYWDIDTSHLDMACGTDGVECDGVAGLTDAQLKAGLPDGFDPAIWGHGPGVNNGYPYLLANSPPK